MSRFLRFCIAGAIGFLVDAGVLEALVRQAGINPYAARVVSFLCAATTTYWINRRWTFKARQAPSSSEWLIYLGLMLLGASVNYGVYSGYLMFFDTAHRALWLGVALGSVAGLGVNFATSSRLLAKRPPL